jgi:chromatin remodeling complex protein RSC6
MFIESITALEMSSPVSSVKVNNKMPKKSAHTPESTTPAVATVPATPKKVAKAVPTDVPATPPAGLVTGVVDVDVRSADVVLGSLQETLRSLASDVSARLRAAVHDAQEALRAMKREVRDSKRRRKVDPATLSPEERAVWEARRKNNAFLKPRQLSDELCTFMGLPSKSQRSQTDVTKYVSKYVREHNCFDPSFKRRILPDSKLAKLLRVKDKDDVSYLNLQSFLKVHYVKAV